MRLSGIELRNFRSIGDNRLLLSPWRSCNILIGQNNAGKSNVIRAIRKISAIVTVIDQMGVTQPVALEPNDLHWQSRNNQFMFTLHYECNEDEELAKRAGTNKFTFDWAFAADELARIVDFSLARPVEIWRPRAMGGVNSLMDYFEKGWHFRQHEDLDEVHKVFMERSGLFFSKEFKDLVRPAYMIPEFRQIKRGENYSYDGTNLIQLLGTYQHPLPGRGKDREKFELVELFAQKLLHMPDAKLEVTHDSNQIMLANNDLRLPLISHGTGVHELIIMVTAILSMNNVLWCIEEPEIHLHPRLQKEFVDFLISETSNEYLISTHSPTFINASAHMTRDIGKEVQVFHLHSASGKTSGGPVLNDDQALMALNDLGVKASDLLQSNCVIWVEGPSDRVYLNHWLSLLDPELVEGLHYSIMFYGGGLRAHLLFSRTNSGETEDGVPLELIEVLRINQRAVVVMDSDRKKKGEVMNRTKRRVRDECRASGGVAWVTHGREIENYLPGRVVAATCERLKRPNVRFSNSDPYAKFEEVLTAALNSARVREFDYSADKVNYARRFVGDFRESDFSPELKKQIETIINKIDEWNA